MPVNDLPEVLTAADTLAADTLTVGVFKRASDYDYARDLIASPETLDSVLMGYFRRLINSIFDSHAYDLASRPVLFTIGLIVVAIVAWFVYKARPRFFSRTARDGGDYEVTDDTIYGIDFDSLTQKALSRRDFREASRLVYLKTLRCLSDRSLIVWQLSKTPTQYVAEFRDGAFREMTNLFMHIRYANMTATEADYHNMDGLQRQVLSTLKGGEAGQ